MDGVFEVSSGSGIQNHGERLIDGDFFRVGNKEFWRLQEWDELIRLVAQVAQG